MTARAQHQQEVKELGSEEEDDLEVFDDEKSTSESSTPNAGKGKARAVEIDDEVCAGQKRRRPIVDPFAGMSLVEELVAGTDDQYSVVRLRR